MRGYRTEYWPGAARAHDFTSNLSVSTSRGPAIEPFLLIGTKGWRISEMKRLRKTDASFLNGHLPFYDASALSIFEHKLVHKWAKSPTAASPGRIARVL